MLAQHGPALAASQPGTRWHTSARRAPSPADSPATLGNSLGIPGGPSCPGALYLG